MNKLKKGFRFDNNSLKMVGVIFFWTLLVFLITKNIPQVTPQKITVKYEKIFFLFFFLFLVENYLTSAVYGSLKDMISSINFEWKKFFHYGSHFFGRFLVVKVFLVLLLLLIFLLGSVLVASLKYIPLSFQNILYVIFILWLAFPLFLFCLLLFAPLIIFLEDCPVLSSLKKSFNFLKYNLGSVIVISFLFGIVIFFVNFSFKGYNFNTWGWWFLKALILGFGEVGFIKTYFYFYTESNER
ncbi:MAG: hypothetical protein M1501_02065 [Candidatus Omnitrophica bacterium]|nr:hypothetical protein [Candidatus Omnitrophota bacterium]